MAQAEHVPTAIPARVTDGSELFTDSIQAAHASLLHSLVDPGTALGTNREPLWTHFKLWSTESLYHWLFKTYWRKKREFPAVLSQPEHQHLKLIRFQHPRETDAWLETL